MIKPSFTIGTPEKPYLLRWHLIPRNRFFNIYLHKFLGDDPDRALHDHPWASCSIILRGKYLEFFKDYSILRTAGDITKRGAETAHRVKLLRDFQGNPKPCWTLFLTGRKVRDWGFHCPNGWRIWSDFVDPDNHGEIGRGCD